MKKKTQIVLSAIEYTNKSLHWRYSEDDDETLVTVAEYDLPVPEKHVGGLISAIVDMIEVDIQIDPFELLTKYWKE